MDTHLKWKNHVQTNALNQTSKEGDMYGKLI